MLNVLVMHLQAEGFTSIQLLILHSKKELVINLDLYKSFHKKKPFILY